MRYWAEGAHALSVFGAGAAGFGFAMTGFAKRDSEAGDFDEIRSTILFSSQLLRFEIEAAVSPLSSAAVHRSGSPIVRRIMSLDRPDSFQPSGSGKAY